MAKMVLRSVFDWIQIQFDRDWLPPEIIEDILFLDYDLFIEIRKLML